MQTGRQIRTGLTVLLVTLLAATTTVQGAETKPTAVASNAIPRDPFWPMGYVPREVKQAIQSREQDMQQQAQAKALVQWPALSLTGITKTGDRNIGLIHGVGLVEAGDIVRMSRDGVMYKWVITEISEHGLAYRKISAKPISLDGPDRDPKPTSE